MRDKVIVALLLGFVLACYFPFRSNTLNSYRVVEIEPRSSAYIAPPAGDGEYDLLFTSNQTQGNWSVVVEGTPGEYSFSRGEELYFTITQLSKYVYLEKRYCRSIKIVSDITTDAPDANLRIVFNPRLSPYHESSDTSWIGVQERK